MIDNCTTTSQRFLETVASWIAKYGEVLVLIRLHGGGGNRSFEFFASYKRFTQRLSALPPRASVIVFKEQQLPLRGLVDEDFVIAAMNSIPDGSRWLVVGLTETTAGSQSWFHQTSGFSSNELDNELRDTYCWGQQVAVGIEPDINQVSDGMISGFVPDDDGMTRPGVY